MLFFSLQWSQTKIQDLKIYRVWCVSPKQLKDGWTNMFGSSVCDSIIQNKTRLYEAFRLHFKLMVIRISLHFELMVIR